MKIILRQLIIENGYFTSNICPCEHIIIESLYNISVKFPPQMFAFKSKKENAIFMY